MNSRKGVVKVGTLTLLTTSLKITGTANSGRKSPLEASEVYVHESNPLNHSVAEPLVFAMNSHSPKHRNLLWILGKFLRYCLNIKC